MKSLEFDARVLPDGTLRMPVDVANQLAANARVHVVVTPTERDPEAVRKAIESTHGAWKDDPSIPGIFEQIERERHADMGRPVDPTL